jgi:hypothetical protein
VLLPDHAAAVAAEVVAEELRADQALRALAHREPVHLQRALQPLVLRLAHHRQAAPRRAQPLRVVDEADEAAVLAPTPNSSAG